MEKQNRKKLRREETNMKHRKKRTILTLLLTLAMVFSLNITAFAAQPKAASSVTVHYSYYGENGEVKTFATETYTEANVDKAMPAVNNLADIGFSKEEIPYCRFTGWYIKDPAGGNENLCSDATTMTKELFDKLAAAGSEFTAYVGVDVSEEEQEVTVAFKFVDSNGNPLSREAYEKAQKEYIEQGPHEEDNAFIEDPINHGSLYDIFQWIQFDDLNGQGEYVDTFYCTMPLDGSAGKLSVDCSITGFDISYDPASTIDVVKGQPAKITVICKLKSTEASTGSAANATTNSANKPAAKDKVPKTGETDHLGLLLAVAICGAAGMIAFGRKRQTAR